MASDVNDAALALDFGGVASSDAGGTRGAPTVQTTTTQPSRGLTDNSNAGLVNRNLFREDNQANTDWWVGGDSASNVTATAGVNRSSAEGGLSGAVVFGEPTVQTPTSSAPDTFDLDAAPSLFPDQNEWWKDGALAQGASTSNEGGSIWEGSEQIGDFGDDLALGSDLNTSLDSLQFGEDYPEVETAETPFTSFAEGTGIPIEPDVLDQEYEWTTSPEDRRFLAGPPEEETPQDVAGTISTGGTSMSNFGGNMSLGNFLNTPLELMNFGGGYPQVQGGIADTSGRDHMNTGATQIDPITEQPFNLDAIPTATGGQTYTPPGETWASGTQGSSGNTSAPSGLRIIGRDTRNGQPIYEDDQGNRYVNSGTGSPAVSNNRNYDANAHQAYSQMMMMAAGASPMMIPKFIGQTGDVGRTIFNPRLGRPNISLENGMIVRQPGGRTIGRGNTPQVGGLG